MRMLSAIWKNVTVFVLKDGHLFLELGAATNITQRGRNGVMQGASVRVTLQARASLPPSLTRRPMTSWNLSPLLLVILGLEELTPTTVELMDPLRGTGSGQMDRSGDINHGDQDNQVIQIAEMIILHSMLVHGMTLGMVMFYLSFANMTHTYKG